MAAGILTKKLNLSLLLSLFLVASASSLAKVPPTCNLIECPCYHVIHVGDGYEIHRYNSTVWVSTSPIQHVSLVQATRTGFRLLFDYIQGKNDYNQKIEMTAPVITEACDGHFCESKFEVSFYVPKKNQANPPPADGLFFGRSKPVYAAVRQFSGFVRDSDVGEQVGALRASIEGTKWSFAFAKSKRAGYGSYYCVAQYSAPFEFDDRVNEIWFLFDDMENGSLSI